ncbi:DUF1631 family protein [Alcanivorax sp.]|uniref:DUF1631 family protein n=1 Tax=Alcanivorax sp. TaxID=1872427 RepID=UPI0025B8C92E|nr:DUF1631 family protein [Alcanivorax sp.]
MAKVTQLKPVSGKAGTNSLPRPIEKVRDRYVALASSYLEDMLDGADDTLYDLAEKEAEGERERFFDAMRELRIQRSGLVAGLKQSLQHQFAELAQQRAGGTLENARVDLDSLTLVNEDDLETAELNEKPADRPAGRA